MTQLSKRERQLLVSLKSALRYIEVQTAYTGAMSAEKVEAAILERRNVSRVEIGANSCSTLAAFDLRAAREIIADAEGESR